MNPETNAVNLFWFRRDLRLEDNTALFEALQAGYLVLPVFIFDTGILNTLENKSDARVEFIHQTLSALHDQLNVYGSGIDTFYGTPLQAFAHWTEQYIVHAVYTNIDYEPYARERDAAVQDYLASKGIEFHGFKDQVIFDRDDILKDNGDPYTVFTPYSRRWKQMLGPADYRPRPSEKGVSHFLQHPQEAFPPINRFGFTSSPKTIPSAIPSLDIIKNYARDRDLLAVDGTSRMGIHLRFGTVSIRSLVGHALRHSPVYLNELIWREFYQMILWHFPEVGRGRAFKPAYELIRWRNNEQEFDHWCKGTTGYPLVDAGMRQLNQTGFMHNRARMVTASFLAKHLLIDWRWGEAYFAEKLLDFDLAANNGGWQWCAGSGCDAAPYFRIFNPALQAGKFDPEGIYIRRWVPEIDELHYPLPMIDHQLARQRALEVYGRALRRQ